MTVRCAHRDAVARRRAAAAPRTILLWVIVLIVVALGMHAVAPWILPARIYEGPLVQMASETGVTLIWYTTRPAPCRVVVSAGGQDRTFPAEAEGRRNRVRIDGLEPGTTYAYEVQLNRGSLTHGLTFQTNRSADQRYTFLVLGDSGKATRAQFSLAAEMAVTQPPADFILHTGDLVYGTGKRAGYEDRFFAPYRQLLARVNFWPCLGNHDVEEDDDVSVYTDIFELPDNGPPGVPPERDYWFDYASCRIAVFDSNADAATLRDHVAPWLRTVMSGSAARWKFVAFHHPPYTAGRHHAALAIQETIVPVIEEVGVDLVFNGHDHNYQRTYPLLDGHIVEPGRGLIYIVTGAGGAEFYDMKPADQRPAYLAACNDHQHSFTQVTIAGDDLTLRQIAVGGQILDELTLHKPAGGNPSSTPTTAPPTAEPTVP